MVSFFFSYYTPVRLKACQLALSSRVMSYWGTGAIVPGCPSCRHQWLLSDLNPGPAGCNPNVLTTKPWLLPLIWFIKFYYNILRCLRFIHYYTASGLYICHHIFCCICYSVLPHLVFIVSRASRFVFGLHSKALHPVLHLAYTVCLCLLHSCWSNT